MIRRGSSVALLGAGGILLLLYKPFFQRAVERPEPAAGARPAPAGQPTSGPGGSDYPHRAVATHGPFWVAGHQGDDGFRYFVYTPSEPKPEQAPVVLFLHGWTAHKPDAYAGWMAHLVKKGHIVVWPQYQLHDYDFWNWFDQASAAWSEARGKIRTGAVGVAAEKMADGRIRSAFVGHSLGSVMAACLAGKANSMGEDAVPLAIVAFQPGGKGFLPTRYIASVDPKTRLLVVIGAEDDHMITSGVDYLWKSLSFLPPANRTFLVAQSDARGEPQQLANHYFPNTNGFRDTATIDARDFYVTFKLSTAALNCSFRGTDCQYAYGAGAPEQVDMGKWSDGVPQKPLLWMKDPSQLRPLLEQLRKGATPAAKSPSTVAAGQ